MSFHSHRKVTTTIVLGDKSQAQKDKHYVFLFTHVKPKSMSRKYRIEEK